MVEARNVQAIRGWFATQRADVKKEIVDSLLSNKESRAVLFAGFEAGRHFQAQYPHLDPLNIAVYEPMHPIPDAPASEPTPAEVVAAKQIPTTLEANVEADAQQIKPKSVWIHRRTKDTCTAKRVESGNVIVADSFGEVRTIPTYMFLQSFNPKGGA